MILRDLLCLEHSAVVLPGSVHTLTVQAETGSHLLALWRGRKNPEPGDAEGFAQTYPQDNGTQPTPPNMVGVPPTSQYLLGLIPSAQGDSGNTACVCRVVAVGKRETDPETTLVVRGCVRGAVAVAVAVAHTPGTRAGPFASHVRLEDTAQVRAGYPPRDIRPAVFATFRQMEAVETAVNEFAVVYGRAAESPSAASPLLMSPLANTLHFQLHGPGAQVQWDAVKRAGTETVRLAVRRESREDSREQPGLLPGLLPPVLLLMDRVVALLPVPRDSKRAFLLAAELSERLALFAAIAEAFVAVFPQLYSAAAYLGEHYAAASVVEKTALVAVQLRALRGSLGGGKRRAHPGDPGDPGDPGSTLGGESSPRLMGSPGGSDDSSPLRAFMQRVGQLGLHPDAVHTLTKDYEKLKSMRGNKNSAEFQQLQNYFDVVVDIPFGKYASTTRSVDLRECRRVLDSDHFGLLQVKRRLAEYLSVLKLQQQQGASSDVSVDAHPSRPPILMLVGPPGVGKTSVARSVARALGRKYQRISLGGIYNEADLRGHRRTYVGAMCGAIVNALRKSQSMNPLIVLDELDKVGGGASNRSGSGSGSGANGDPAAALLEILDFEQNSTFTDHYLGFPLDISQVLFFCTANDASTISPPLLDRLEILRIPGYTLAEKIKIGERFLLPKQIALNGLDRCPGAGFTLAQDAWNALVTGYTAEAGVRTLERKLAAIVRAKIVLYVQGDDAANISGVVSVPQVYEYLGFPRIRVTQEVLAQTRFEETRGIINGLSYNTNGTGSVMLFEVVRVGSVGQGVCGPEVQTTGNLGDTLRESVQIATSVVNSIIVRELISGLDVESAAHFLSGKYHLHAPTGGVPKDGPSAGMAITLCLLSLALDMEVPRDLCMTGEITLRGKVLPIGGLKEKLLGASASHMSRVLVPLGNCNDVVAAAVEDIAPYAKGGSKRPVTPREIQHRQQRDAELLHSRTGLQLTYVNDIYDAIAALWPEVQFSTASFSHTRDSKL